MSATSFTLAKFIDAFAPKLSVIIMFANPVKFARLLFFLPYEPEMLENNLLLTISNVFVVTLLILKNIDSIVFVTGTVVEIYTLSLLLNPCALDITMVLALVDVECAI